MASKSKKRSSKTNKSNKSGKSTRAKQQGAKQQSKAAQQMAKPSVDTLSKPQTANKNSSLIVGLILCFFIAIIIGLLLIGTAEDKSIQSSAKPTVNPNSQQTIEVVEPNSSRPQPTGYQIQGSTEQGQNAQGGLQTPQTGDQLQPNAKIKDYENAQLN